MSHAQQKTGPGTSLQGQVAGGSRGGGGAALLVGSAGRGAEGGALSLSRAQSDQVFKTLIRLRETKQERVLPLFTYREYQKRT